MLAEENFGGVGSTRKLVEKTLVVAEAKPIQYLSLRDLTTFWQINL